VAAVEVSGAPLFPVVAAGDSPLVASAVRLASGRALAVAVLALAAAARLAGGCLSTPTVREQPQAAAASVRVASAAALAVLPGWRDALNFAFTVYVPFHRHARK